MEPGDGSKLVAIRFTGFDAPAWNLRARELAMALLNPTHSALRSRLIYRTNVPNHPKTVGMKINGLRPFAEWLTQTLPDRGLDELRQHHFDAFLIDLKSQGRSSSTRMAIAALRDLHTFGDVLTGGGFSFRPWGNITADALSGRSRTTPELTTPVIPPNVWWPLLRACWQYIDVFSHDIFAAGAEWDALSQRPTGKESAGVVDDELVEWMSRPSSAIPVQVMPDSETTSERRLRDAMERLLSGKAIRTDGRLIKENLYREAGVSRATMNRAVQILAEWSRRVGTAQPRDREIEELKRQLKECRSDVRALRSRVQEIEAQLTIAATSVAELHVENQRLRSDDAGSSVALMRPRSNGRRE